MILGKSIFCTDAINCISTQQMPSSPKMPEQDFGIKIENPMKTINVSAALNDRPLSVAEGKGVSATLNDRPLSEAEGRAFRLRSTTTITAPLYWLKFL